MPSFQEITLIGHLGKNPETRNLESGNVTTFSLAVTEKWKTKDGEQKEDTEWFNIEAWGKQGEVLATYLQQGSAIFLKGRIKTDTWEKDGVKQYRQKVRVTSFQFLGGKTDSTPNTGSSNNDTQVEGEDALPF